MRKTIRALTIAPRSMSVGLTPSTVSPARRSMPQPPLSGEPNTLRIGVTIDDTNVSTTAANAVPMRSEEHTSELQSRENLVCRLLLEKKKTPETDSADEQG